MRVVELVPRRGRGARAASRRCRSSRPRRPCRPRRRGAACRAARRCPRRGASRRRRRRGTRRTCRRTTAGPKTGKTYPPWRQLRRRPRARAARAARGAPGIERPGSRGASGEGIARCGRRGPAGRRRDGVGGGVGPLRRGRAKARPTTISISSGGEPTVIGEQRHPQRRRRSPPRDGSCPAPTSSPHDRQRRGRPSRRAGPASSRTGVISWPSTVRPVIDGGGVGRTRSPLRRRRSRAGRTTPS